MTDNAEAGAKPRLAASVILLRDGAEGLEVFVQHRVSTMDFAAGMVVFPGGRVDEVDKQGWEYPEELLIRHAKAWGRSSLAANAGEMHRAAAGGAHKVASVAGAEGVADATPPSISPEAAGTLLAAAQREVFEEAGIQLAASELLPWANWVTPTDQPKRFDTFFFLAVPTAGIEPRHLTTEASSSVWMPVSRVLDEEAALTLKLMPPTYVLLGELAVLGSTEAALALERDIEPVRPPAGALQEFLKRRR